jgi:3-phosphoshikimate 1-carboxyvinyltransferase
MRFLTAYFAATPNTEVTLLCDERMEQRPIHELVTALKELGADISYINNEGFPPLRISGKKLQGGSISISATASSQYVSALMMIAPMCENGLTIELTGTVTSFPYIKMTAELMEQFGWRVGIREEDNVVIHIAGEMGKSETRNSKTENRNTQSEISNPKSEITIEPDWSAASYWYEMAALSKECDILLEGLSLNSLQGDAVIARYMEYFGVHTEEEPNGIRLTKEIQHPTSNIQHLKSQILHLTFFPDLTPTLAVTAAALNMPITLSGLQNLRIKESNRLEALRAELTKLGFDVNISDDDLFVRMSSQSAVRSPQHDELQHLTSNISHPTSQISTYSDHRMAMAFAPLALVLESVTIEHPEVVEKSYPHFWEDLKHIGFSLR